MFSWRAVRTTCLVLLLMPVVHLAYLVSSDVIASLDPSPNAWQDEIDAFRRADLAGKLPPDPILVVGGMRVKLWQGLEDILAPHPVLMRGIGDAIVEDIIHNHGQLISYYRPRAVIFLPGNSEFHIRDGKSAAELVSGIKELVAMDTALESTGQFFVMSPKLVRSLSLPGKNLRLPDGFKRECHSTVEALLADRGVEHQNGTPKLRYRDLERQAIFLDQTGPTDSGEDSSVTSAKRHSSSHQRIPGRRAGGGRAAQASRRPQPLRQDRL